MSWSFSPHRPVYYQVAERIRRSILSGEYLPGAQIPSVRQLALEAAVNPNTIQHAFSELEHRGLIESRGTLGRFVTENTETIEECRKYEAEMLVDGIISKAAALKIPGSDIIRMISEREQKIKEVNTDNERS